MTHNKLSHDNLLMLLSNIKTALSVTLYLEALIQYLVFLV